ncbi:MAG: energy transducer TonB [Chloracidobacterium sp.]|nr:energy transducer TonB [Chloracidobacterium sp.]
MKNNIGKRLLSPVCVLAMIANSMSGVMAQERKDDGKVIAVQPGVEIAATINTRIQEAINTRIQEAINRGYAGAAQQGGDSVFQFFLQEMSFDSRLVKGAPFSADVVSETIQNLPDGNRIVQRSEGRSYRDSQGRTRNERTYQIGGSSEQKQTITIFDPVADANYILDPETKIARKTISNVNFMPPPSLMVVPPANINMSGGILQDTAIKMVQPSYPPAARMVNASGPVQVRITIGETGKVIEARAVSGHQTLRSAAVEAAYQWLFKPTESGGKPVKVQGVLVFEFRPPPLSTSVPATTSIRADTSKKISVSGGVLQGKAIVKVQPQYPPIARAARASGAVQVQVTISETGEVMEADIVSGHPLLREAALQAARQWLFKPTELSGTPVKVQGILTFNFSLGDEVRAQASIANSVSKYPTNTEQLGKRTVEGVECEGTRAVTTMPPGVIGNERPIETVNEIWYSPELQMTILSKRGDPRFGESTYQVTNIVRTEPDATLFQIPSDYTIIDSRTKKVEIDVKEFEEMRRKLEEAKKAAEGARKRKPNDQ